MTGWTGERVCFAGDSAGGNLVLSTALRAVSYQIKVPDGIMAAYTPTLVQYTPSPARLMSMIDPLLPVGILTRCLAGRLAQIVLIVVLVFPAELHRHDFK